MRLRALGHGCRATLAVLALALISVQSAADGIRDVDARGVQDLISRGVKVIDVRTPEEWRQTGLVPGSATITAFNGDGSLDPGFVRAVKATAKPGDEIVLICRSGNRSAAAARLLRDEAGYTAVHNATGGIRAWIADGRPVEPCRQC